MEKLSSLWQQLQALFSGFYQKTKAYPLELVGAISAIFMGVIYFFKRASENNVQVEFDKIKKEEDAKFDKKLLDIEDNTHLLSEKKDVIKELNRNNRLN